MKTTNTKRTKKAEAAPVKLPKGIRLHPTSGYMVNVTHNGTRKFKAAATLDEAIIARELLLDELKEEYASQNNEVNKTWTLEQAFEKTFKLQWAGTGGEKTSVINSSAALKFFGKNMPITKITLERIDEYITSLMEYGNSGATINRKLTALSTMLRTALDRGKLQALPKMPRRREGEHRIRFLTQEEEKQLFTIADQLGYYAQAEAIKMLIYSGFRCGELWRLAARDIDLEQGIMTAWKTKGGHPRTVPIADVLRPIIEKRVEQGGKLFPEGSNQWLRNAWMHIKHHMGLDDDVQFVPHILRHTFATRLVQRRASMPVVQRLMGHSTIQMTARYAHFAPSELQEAVRSLCN